MMHGVFGSDGTWQGRIAGATADDVAHVIRDLWEPRDSLTRCWVLDQFVVAPWTGAGIGDGPACASNGLTLVRVYSVDPLKFSHEVAVRIAAWEGLHPFRVPRKAFVPAPILPSLVSAPEARLNGGGL